MKKRIFLIVLLFLLLLVFEVHAAVLYSQSPSSSGVLFRSSWVAPNNSDIDEYVWDSFQMNSTQSISAITWWGGYILGSGVPAANFTVAIYASIPGGSQPDVVNPPLVEYIVGGNAGETIDRIVGSTVLYRYHFILPTPFVAVGGTTYWVQIEAWQYGVPDWGISEGIGGNGNHFRRVAGTHQYYIAQGDTAFTLSDSAVNHPPVAKAGPDQAVGVDAAVTLDGSLSSDVDGDPLTFSWSFVSVPAGSTATLSNTAAASPTFVADIPGTYVIQLIVNDNIANSTPDTVVITCGFTPITLLSPNGGEVFSSGSTYTVAWLAPPDATRFNLRYSMDNGLTWNKIATNIRGTSHNWTVPKPLRNERKCLVRVIGYNASGIRIGIDRSDTPFTIEVIKLNAPSKPGISMTSGNTYLIKWTTNETNGTVAKTRLMFTRDAGSKWERIEILPGNPGNYLWTVPNVLQARTRCKVRVALLDTNGIVLGTDVSNNYFAIQPLP